jgi:hypothetical protein
MLLSALAAYAASFSAEDLVSGWRRGLPEDTLALMAQSVDGGSDTAVYLLRRGVPPDHVRAMGYDVGDAEGFGAERLGPLDAQSAVSDTDWGEMRQLPTAIERLDGHIVGGDVVRLSASRVVLADGEDRVEVQRSEVHDLWLDPRPLRMEIDAVTLPSPDRRVLLGKVGVGAGATLAMAGAMWIFGSAGGFADLQGTGWQGGTLVGAGREPDPLGVALGSLTLLAGGATVHFSLKDLDLRVRPALPL